MYNITTKDAPASYSKLWYHVCQSNQRAGYSLDGLQTLRVGLVVVVQVNIINLFLVLLFDTEALTLHTWLSVVYFLSLTKN